MEVEDIIKTTASSYVTTSQCEDIRLQENNFSEASRADSIVSHIYIYISMSGKQNTLGVYGVPSGYAYTTRMRDAKHNDIPYCLTIKTSTLGRQALTPDFALCRAGHTQIAYNSSLC